jgi:crotonobetainyl-CoA:carnitine CoA-transferase CaiB-like acyl-CoA transferase
MLPIRMPGGNVAKLPTTPICFDDEAPALRRQPPAAGEHTQEVLHALGYTDEKIAALRAGGAVS